MSAPRGNQFAKGNKGGGRRGYEFENDQLLRMREFLNRFLTLLEKIEMDKATKRQLIIFKEIERIALKIFDKLHPDRHAIKEEPEKPLLILRQQESKHFNSNSCFWNGNCYNKSVAHIHRR